MMPKFHILIPARYASSRFPGKLLQDLAGQTVLQRVYKQALLAKPASIVILTDHEKIMEQAQAYGAHCVLSAVEYISGTDRIAAWVAQQNYDDQDIIVNVQGDEPFIQPELIQQVACNISKEQVVMATLCAVIHDQAALYNTNVVKVVRNCYNHALYFSRNLIPAHRHDANGSCLIYKHVGLYAYKASFLKSWVHTVPCILEQEENLEQLRVLWLGHSIHVDLACLSPQQDINTPEDLAIARQQF